MKCFTKPVKSSMYKAQTCTYEKCSGKMNSNLQNDCQNVANEILNVHYVQYGWNLIFFKTENKIWHNVQS
jgi:hypothetical protein